MGHHAAPLAPLLDKYARLTFVLAKRMPLESPPGYASRDEHGYLVVAADPKVLRCHCVVAESALSDLRETCRLVTDAAIGADEHPVIVQELADRVGVVLNHRLIPRRHHRPQLTIQVLLHCSLLLARGGLAAANDRSTLFPVI